MDLRAFKEAFLREYKGRNVPRLIQLTTRLQNQPVFQDLCRRLVVEGKIASASTRIEDIIRALALEAEQELATATALGIDANYFEIGEQLKRKFDPKLAEIYLSTKMPSDFLAQVRIDSEHGDASQLSDALVEEYKKELIRIEDGRRIIVDTLQPFSNFPLTHVAKLNTLFPQLYQKLRAGYKYLSVKPYLLNCYQTQSPSDSQTGEELDIGQLTLFPHYLENGEEPPLDQQIEFQIAVERLFQFVRKQEALSQPEWEQFWKPISALFNYQTTSEVAPKGRKILEELLRQVNRDKSAMLERLAKTFVEEFLCAEEMMRIRHRIIRTDLACTKEYLKRLAPSVQELSPADEERARLALEKLVCLKEVFVLSERQQAAAEKKSLSELERSALDISAAASPTLLTNWIKIYSIIFSNSQFLSYSDRKLDLPAMRDLISDLTTSHLIQNIAQLKIVVDRSLDTNEATKSVQFSQFNDALKIKLQGLMGSSKQEEKSLREMIQELVFLQNESAQFVIAETFKGFQTIVDAFNSTANDYFVRDRETLLKESRALYDQICSKCLKGFVNQPIGHLVKKPQAIADRKRSWLGRLFSS